MQREYVQDRIDPKDVSDPTTETTRAGRSSVEAIRRRACPSESIVSSHQPSRSPPLSYEVARETYDRSLWATKDSGSRCDVSDDDNENYSQGGLGKRERKGRKEEEGGRERPRSALCFSSLSCSPSCLNTIISPYLSCSVDDG